jgi:hypothetical protein
MKSPRIAAALLAMPLLCAFIGIIVSMQKASFLNINATVMRADIGVSIKVTHVVNFGNTQARVVTVSATLDNGQSLPVPSDFNTSKFNSACPDINGIESCYSPDSNACAPSSAWALIVVNQLFTSFAIVMQVTMVIALYFGKGNRTMHQILNSIAVILLLISVISIMNVPVRLYQVCLGQTFAFSSAKGVSFTAVPSYTFDAGGEDPSHPVTTLSGLTLPSSYYSNPHLRSAPCLILRKAIILPS